jgi:glycyl-tRNA synthetase beta chain
MSYQFLLEVLCEEIPANALAPARQQLAERFAALLAEAGIEGATVRALSTVRRLVVHLAGLPQRLPDRVETVTGPPARVAFAPDGSPTQAALGFARGQGVEVGELRVLEGPKGAVVAVTRTIEGRSTVALLADAVPALVASLHFPKTMRWGGGEHTFVRPVHRVVALFGETRLDTAVPFELFGVASGTTTLGHRVVAPQELDVRGVAGLEGYLARLAEAGVIVDQEVRRARLAAAIEALAAEVGCQVRPDAALVAEHVELVEYPGVARGGLAERFLALPEEVLVTTLRHHQKCLVLEREGRVAPFFLAVADRPDDPEGHVVRGNEWVAGARLADAEFFFQQDRRKSLADHGAGLDRLVFHQKVGSFAQKTEAVVQLAESLARQQEEGLVESVRRAARLAKADLVTAMVGEFPELQGIVGGIYAQLDGESEAVWQAIADQYRPAGLEGPIPRGVVGAILGVADRLDTLAALFAAGEVPTGSKDPFALRRAALAVVKICAEAPLPRVVLQDAAAAAVALRAGDGELVHTLLEFLREREHYYLVTVAGVSTNVAAAVLGARWGVVVEDVARARALEGVREEPIFADLAQAFKRVRHMVAKAGAPVGGARRRSLVEPAELSLAEALGTLEKQVAGEVAAGRYGEALRLLAGMVAPLDRFFTDVLVLCEDEELRQARLSLLREVEALFLGIADLSCLAAGG